MLSILGGFGLWSSGFPRCRGCLYVHMDAGGGFPNAMLNFKNWFVVWNIFFPHIYSWDDSYFSEG